jgi:uncharacterized protein (DUF427 family)
VAILSLFGRSGRRRATVDSAVVAEAEATTRVSGYEYFPPESVDWSRLVPNGRTSVCPWKGVATYYDVIDGDRRLDGAAWVYQDPKPEADHIRGHVAFWGRVKVGAPGRSDS